MFAVTPEDGEVEDGEVGNGVGGGEGDATPGADPMEEEAETPEAPAAREAAQAEDSAAQASREGNGKAADGVQVHGLAHQYYENGDGAATPAETPLAAEALPKKSKWAEVRSHQPHIKAQITSVFLCFWHKLGPIRRHPTFLAHTDLGI